MTLRQNVRNLLVPMTPEEVERELELSIERGDMQRAEYVKEFLLDLEREFNGNYDDCDCDCDWEY